MVCQVTALVYTEIFAPSWWTVASDAPFLSWMQAAVCAPSLTPHQKKNIGFYIRKIYASQLDVW